ncbi:hypothetical protein GCM10010532_097630 [Dactylosporangium siamense]
MKEIWERHAERRPVPIMAALPRRTGRELACATCALEENDRRYARRANSLRTNADVLLAGDANTEMQFNVGDTCIGSSTGIQRASGRWVMPPGSTGLIWPHNQPSFEPTIRPNPARNCPMPSLVP